MKGQVIFTQEYYMKKLLEKYSITNEEITIIINEFTETKDQYYRNGILTDKLTLMPFNQIIKIIANKNDINILII